MRKAHDIPASLISLRIAVAELHGGNKATIMEKAGISPELLSNPTNRVTVEQTLAVWQAIIEETGFHAIGLEAGSKVNFSSVGVLGYVMMNSSTIKASFEQLCRYQRLVASIIFQEVVTEGDIVTFKCEMQEDWQELFRYTVDFVIAGDYTIIRNNTLRQVQPLRMGFNYAQEVADADYERLFPGVEILFNQPYPFLQYKHEDLLAPMTNANTGMLEHFKQVIEQATLEHDRVQEHSRKVKTLIANGLQTNVPMIEEVASEMAMSARSLQANLKKESTSFQILLNEVRKEAAIRHLKNPVLNITDVAFLTGFSDISVFSRNFKKWTGESPSKFKSQFQA